MKSRLTLLVVLLVIGTATSSWADSVLVYEWDLFPSTRPITEIYNDISFSFDGNNLSLNTDRLTGTCRGDQWVMQLLFAGNWGVCGSFDSSTMEVVPDPYATFVANGFGSGHIEWASDAPLGHTTTLLLGYPFRNDGAASYTVVRAGVPVVQEVGTLILSKYRTNVPREWMDEYEQVWREFPVTNAVPEPSSLLAFACGLAGLGRLIRKRRR